MRRRLDRGLDIRLTRASLQACELIAQLLDFNPLCGVLGGKCLNEVQQLDYDLTRLQIGNRVGVEVRNLHTHV